MSVLTLSSVVGQPPHAVPRHPRNLAFWHRVRARDHEIIARSRIIIGEDIEFAHCLGRYHVFQHNRVCILDTVSTRTARALSFDNAFLYQVTNVLVDSFAGNSEVFARFTNHGSRACSDAFEQMLSNLFGLRSHGYHPDRIQPLSTFQPAIANFLT